MKSKRYLTLISILVLVILSTAIALIFNRNYFLNFVGLGHLDSIQNKSQNVILSKATQNKFDIEIQGNMLLSNGKPFLLKGVTSNYFRFHHSYYKTYFNNVNDLINSFEDMRKLGANTVQLYLNEDLFYLNESEETYYDQLQQIVDWGFQNGVWIVLNPVNDVPWVNGEAFRTEDGILKRNRVSVFLEELSRKFGGSKNVMFGIEAEPKFIDDVAMINERGNAIRRYSNNPILVPDQNFYGEISMIAEINKGLDFKDIIVDYHPYSGRNRKQPGKDILDLSQIVDSYVYSIYPSILGEFGGFWEKDFNSDEDVAITLQIGNIAKDNNISFIVYSLDDKLIPMIDLHGNLNKRGQAAKKLFE